MEPQQEIKCKVGMEQHEIQRTMDEIFKFKIGDIVQHAILGNYNPTVQGKHAETFERDKDSWHYHFHFSEKARFQVVERVLQQCHGGCQLKYYLRYANRDGVVDRNLVELTEPELRVAEPFRVTTVDKQTYDKTELGDRV